MSAGGFKKDSTGTESVSEGSPTSTPQGENPTERLNAIQPGMAKIMREVSERYYYAYYAAKEGNWKLAAHQLSQLRGAFRMAKVTRPKYAQDLDAFDSDCIVPILRAIQAKDWSACEEAFGVGLEGSDTYHDKWGYSYIRFILPPHAPQDVYLGPPEKFSRRKTNRADNPTSSDEL